MFWEREELQMHYPCYQAPTQLSNTCAVMKVDGSLEMRRGTIELTMVSRARHVWDVGCQILDSVHKLISIL